MGRARGCLNGTLIPGSGLMIDVIHHTCPAVGSPFVVNVKHAHRGGVFEHAAKSRVQCRLISEVSQHRRLQAFFDGRVREVELSECHAVCAVGGQHRRIHGGVRR